MYRVVVRYWMMAAAALVLVGAPTRAQASLISERQELQMGHDAARQVESRHRVSRDAHRIAVVEEMGKRLAAVSGRPKIPWQFRVLDTPEVNALSVPGYVYINTGLMEFTGTDRDQLAAVVAHEIAHTTRRHAVRQTEKAMIGRLAMRFLFGNDRSLTRELAGMAANLALLGYGRKDELEADRVGAEYMIRAGYDPQGMVRFFRNLQARQGRERRGLETYFRTHPPAGDRIEKVQEYLAAREKNPPAARAADRAAQPAPRRARSRGLFLRVVMPGQPAFTP